MGCVGFLDANGKGWRYDDIPHAYYNGANFRESLPALTRLRWTKDIYDKFSAARLSRGLPPVQMMNSPTSNMEAARAKAMEAAHDYFAEPADNYAADYGQVNHAINAEKTEVLNAMGLVNWVRELPALYMMPGTGLFMPMSIDLVEYLYDFTALNIWDEKNFKTYRMKFAMDPAQWEIGGELEKVTVQLNTYRMALEHGAYRMVIDPMTGSPNGDLEWLEGVPCRNMFALIGATDWTKRDGDAGIPRRDRFTVPRLDDGFVAEYHARQWKDHSRIRQYVRDYRSGRIALGDLTAVLPPCTQKDRWMSGGKFEVRRTSNANATKTFEYKGMEDFGLKQSLANKDCAARNEKYPGEYVVEHKTPHPTRCADGYCKAAAHCDQFRREYPELHAAVAAKWSKIAAPPAEKEALTETG